MLEEKSSRGPGDCFRHLAGEVALKDGGPWEAAGGLSSVLLWAGDGG